MIDHVQTRCGGAACRILSLHMQSVVVLHMQSVVVLHGLSARTIA